MRTYGRFKLRDSLKIWSRNDSAIVHDDHCAVACLDGVGRIDFCRSIGSLELPVRTAG